MAHSKIDNRQVNMFQSTERFAIDKPIRLIELFAGYGSQALALKYLDVPFEHWCISEWAINSIRAYKNLHYTDIHDRYDENLTNEEILQYLDGRISSDYDTPLTTEQIKKKPYREIYNQMKQTKNCGSIMLMSAKDLNIVDTDKYEYILTYSFPCFTGDSLVLTSDGYKRIDEILPGDKVITHTRKYKNVLKVFNNGIKPLLKIRTMSADEIKCTLEHRFYIRHRHFEHQKRMFNDPEWKQAKDITKDDYFGIPINRNSIIPKWDGIDFEWKDGRKTRHKNQLGTLMDNTEFWWLVGRYVADGWKRSQGGIVIGTGANKAQNFESRISKLFHYNSVNDKTVTRFIIPLTELEKFVAPFGFGAANKKIPGFVFDLPIHLLKAFLDGYMSGDGCFTEGVYKATTVSRELAYGLIQVVAKVYHAPAKMYKFKRKPKCIIEGRTVNQKDTYTVAWKVNACKQDKAFYENGYIWHPIRNITEIEPETVYDIEVEDDHSFTVQNEIVHNCQDLSLSGKKAGMSKAVQTRSGLLWEVERLLKECDEFPQVLIMENVPQVIGAANKADFDEWLSFLKSKGYTSKYQIYNTTEFKVPQNRERCFMVSVLGDYHIPMPKPMPLDLKLKDVLENNVDEKYYLRDKTIEMYMERTERMKAKGNGFAFKPREREREPSCGDNNDKSRRANGRQLYNRQFPFNADDEICRTIKAQYAQSSMANFQRQDTFGATGVALDCSYDIQVEREREREREQNQTSAKIDGQRQVQCESDRRTDSSSINSEYGQRICGRLSTIYGGVRLHQTMSYFKGVMSNISRTLTTQADTALVEMRIYADE